VFFCFPWSHIDSDLGQQAESCRFIDAIDLCEVDAADAKRFFPKIELRLVPPLLFCRPRRFKRFGRIGFRF